MDNRLVLANSHPSAPSPPSPSSSGYFIDGNPATGTRPTIPGAFWFHQVGEELRKVIESAGLTPSESDLTQLAAAIPLLATAQAINGFSKKLSISATGTSATITVTADEIAVQNASYKNIILRGVSLSLSGATSGANGLDTGSLASDTWYSIWIIYNGTTVAGLLSTSESSPTLPSGYTYKCRIGWMRTDSSGNKYPLRFNQKGKRFQYSPAAGSNLTICPTMCSGISGTVGTTLTSQSIVNFIPTTAIEANLAGYVINNTGLQISANSLATIPGATGSVFSIPDNVTIMHPVTFNLEGSNIYWASNGSSNKVLCQGWVDS